jgi:diaminopropionate ammonia-lyase
VLRDGIRGAIAVGEGETHYAMRELAAAGLAIGDSGAAPLAALRALVDDAECAHLRAAAGLSASSRVLLIGTEGPTDPDGYRGTLEARG